MTMTMTTMLVVVVVMMMIIIINRKYGNIETPYIELRNMWSIKTKLMPVNAAAASSNLFRK